MLRAGARLLMFVLGFAMVCFALFTGGAAMTLGVTAGVSLIGLPMLLASNPSDPSPARMDDNGDPWWWDAREKRWIDKAERDARIAGDPYAAKLTADQAFGPDVLAPYAARIAKWKRLHAAGVLTSEQLVERVESPEHNWTDPAKPGSRDERIEQLKAKHRAPRRPAASDPFSRVTKIQDIHASLDALEVRAARAWDAIEAMPRVPKNAKRTCESCASVYTDQSTEPAARYCDGSCNR